MKRLNWLIPFTIIIFVVLVLTIFTYHLAYIDRIYPGIKIANVNVGNQTKDQSRNLILEKINQHPQKLTIDVEGKKYDLAWDKLAVDYNLNESIESAFKIGRGFWLHDWQEKFSTWIYGKNISLVTNFKQDYFDKQVEEIETEFLVPAVEPQIKIFDKPVGNGSRILVENGKDGRELNSDLGRKTFYQKLSNLDYSPIVFKVDVKNPAFSSAEAEMVKIRAEKLLDKKLELSSEENNYNLAEKELISFLAPIGYNQLKISEYILSLSKTLNRPAQNAAFQFENGKVVNFKPGKDGLIVDEEALAQILPATISSLENSEAKSAAIVIPLTKSSPLVKTEDANNLGIKELVGRGQSYFRGSAASRIHNIVLASSKLNGIIVPNGETFSFVKSLGEVSKSTGYQEAYVIKEGRTILDDGGGVCQVSTTFFRAALNSGLPIIERTPHAYRVSYYEQGTQPGIDATVFIPSPDLKFKNDTGQNLLIQTTVDTKTSGLTVEFYGTSDGRIASMSAVKVYDQTPPPPDLYQDDPTLPVGQVKQIEKPIWGAKTSFTWKVTRNGEILQNRTFNSTYQPWQAVYLRGTKPL